MSPKEPSTPTCPASLNFERSRESRSAHWVFIAAYTIGVYWIFRDKVR